MCRKMCLEVVICWDYGGPDFSLISAFNHENKMFHVIWSSERASGLTDTASAMLNARMSVSRSR